MVVIPYTNFHTADRYVLPSFTPNSPNILYHNQKSVSSDCVGGEGIEALCNNTTLQYKGVTEKTSNKTKKAFYYK
jgi:hypothetical protein